jgi:hypothetical protein
MFKRLLFGNEESKLQFKTSTTSGIARLYTDPSISPSDTLYWQNYLLLFDSPSDVFSLVSVSDIRRALTTFPENVATLVKSLVQHLESLQHDPLFSPKPQAATDATSSLAAGLSKNVAGWMPAMGMRSATTQDGNLASSRDRVREALNCCRILARVLPIIMEGEADGSSNQGEGEPLATEEFEKGLLWESKDEGVEEARSLFEVASKAAVLKPGTEPKEDQETRMTRVTKNKAAKRIPCQHRMYRNLLDCQRSSRRLWASA